MILYSTLNNKGKLYSDYLQDDIYNLLDKTFILPLNFNFNILEVTEEYIARPDLISKDAYGDTMFADIICKINGISNPFELNVGMRLILPSPDFILDFAIKADLSEAEVDEKVETPVAKSKTSKRKANEAIVGDTRFKIDSATGIIIY